MTLPKELRDKAKLCAPYIFISASTEPEAYQGFMMGAEWLYGELEPRIKELEAKLKAAEDKLNQNIEVIEGCRLSND